MNYDISEGTILILKFSKITQMVEQLVATRAIFHSHSNSNLNSSSNNNNSPLLTIAIVAVQQSVAVVVYQELVVGV